MTKAATRKTLTAADLRSLLGSNAADAVVDQSALDLVPLVGVRLLEAVGNALEELQPALVVRGVSGHTDPEDREWQQLVLDVSGAEPGTPEWDANLENAGQLVELVAERCPELTRELSAIGFHF